MTIYIRIEKLAQKIAEQCREIDRKSIDRLLDAIIDANRIFIAGAGRSGLVAKAFGMRLMHLGFTVYVVGEVITPAIKAKDLIIIVSGSGQTSSILNVMKTSKAKGAKTAAITSFPDSPIGKGADFLVRIKGRTIDDLTEDYTARQLVGDHEPMTPLGTLFELTTMVFLDAVIEELMRRYQKSEDEMREFHTNLE
ncbi:MAG: 6-phospho-3-hexuloisomerase [Candidatus ainarchaeum sp.]|nr:6-phospho-3-hexuloisomerase [Candidatus ainarchaeum sp.]